ncbi:NAD(P)-dependent oxidoreductase [Streptomyces albidoflavus]|uniref:NAD-dependent epimerase/dehydratase family protein n=1 Tax=Streptomyces albidoflavus TaxID=1886 RepID=A0ABY3GU35_9ACTN|nr:NAD(P)H-binding protein [Streptomyces albidoflavus]TWV19433.1 NAD-dependent epimerase/dehydratase family protein [Streptomyces albidoflavus]
MRITVFGATGGVGGEVVRQALEAGHEVTAVVRDPAALKAGGERLEVARGDLADASALGPLVAGRDAVLSGLGARGRRTDGLVTRLTGAVVAAMEAEGVRRLVMVSAAPVVQPPPDEPLTARLTLAVVRQVFGEVYADLAGAEALLARSGTEWTAVRPPRLTDGPLTGTYRRVTGGNPRAGRSLSRADTAHAMLGAVEDRGTVRQGVGVAY